MGFRKAATSSVVWAATAFALTAGVNAQVDVPGVSPPAVGTQDVADPEISDGAITRNGRLNADAATDAPPAPQAATGSVGVDASGTGADASAQTNNNQPTVDAAASAATPGDGSGADADIDANNESQIRRFKSDQLGATFDSNYNDDLVIQNSPSGSEAARIGLLPGDRIIEVNGKTYNDVDSLNQDLSRWNSNTDIPIIFERNGRRYTQTFRLPAQDGQRTYRNPTQPNQLNDNRAVDSQSISYSANRPDYNMAGNYSNDPAGGGGYGSTVGVAPCGPNPWSGQSCYNGSCHVHQMYWCGSRYSGGRRHHRRCCR